MSPDRQHRKRQQRIMSRVRLFQVSGIALITLSLMNAMLRPDIGLHINFFLMLAAIGQLWFSFWLWERARKPHHSPALQ